MNQPQTGLNFQSSSEYLQLPNVVTAIKKDEKVGQLAHDFDRAHLLAETRPALKYEKCQHNKALRLAVNTFEQKH
jgi:hypothetical protein